MQSEQIGKQDLESIYNLFNEVGDNIDDYVKDKKIIGEELSQFIVMHKVARNSDNFDSFNLSVSSNELPAVKLTLQELELLKGGIAPLVFIVARFVITRGLITLAGRGGS
jgi:hypothetical protein